MSVSLQLRGSGLLWWVISDRAMSAEIYEEDIKSLRLPKDWHSYVRSAVLDVVGIIRVAMFAGCEALIKNGHAKDARTHQLESEVAMLSEELRITVAHNHDF